MDAAFILVFFVITVPLLMVLDRFSFRYISVIIVHVCHLGHFVDPHVILLLFLCFYVFDCTLMLFPGLFVVPVELVNLGEMFGVGMHEDVSVNAPHVGMSDTLVKV